MSEDELKAIEARANAATPGPTWRIGPMTSAGNYNVYAEDGGTPCFAGLGMHARQNAEFVAHAMEDIPKLIAEVRRNRELLKTVYFTLGHKCPFCNSSPDAHDDECPPEEAVGPAK